MIDVKKNLWHIFNILFRCTNFNLIRLLYIYYIILTMS